MEAEEREEQFMDRTINEIARRRGEFRPEAYYFTLDALNRAVESLSVRRHLSGPELLSGVIRLAHERFGEEALEMLTGWGISASRDIGLIVYDLIQAGILSSSEDDRPEDFEGKRPTFADSITATAVLEAVNVSLSKNGEWTDVKCQLQKKEQISL